MTQIARTSAFAAADLEASDDFDGDLGVSSLAIGDRLWHFFISMRTGLALILALAGLGLAGTLLIQADPGLQSDSQAHAVWLESIRPR